MEATLVIGDTHCPAMLRSKRKNYIDHLLMVYEKYDCSHVVHIGDLVDNHALSYHNPKAPRLKDPIKEYGMMWPKPWATARNSLGCWF